ncbi:hypothetical protein OG317_33700 [Streptomyces sp. NBC_01167]|uniref:hypothetical protein n=1 Tax=Streptomyces sp. NBC_01167 TaxID=2903756 RepID=UPI00386C7B49|nr:hypothetical protein OG317_33700 [Streptomyces sp. NBC_01167]
MSFEPTPSPEDRSDDGSTGRTGPFPAGRPDATASSNDEPIRTLLWTAATHRPLDEVAALVSLLNRTGELSRPGDEALRAAAVARPLEEVRQLVTLLNETPHDTGEAGTTLRAAAMGRSIEDVAELVAILGMDHGTRSGTGSMTVPGAESGNQPRPESGTEPRPESTTEATEAETGTEAPFGTEPQSTPFGTEPQEPLSAPFGTEPQEPLSTPFDTKPHEPLSTPFDTEPQAPLSTEFGPESGADPHAPSGADEPSAAVLSPAFPPAFDELPGVHDTTHFATGEGWPAVHVGAATATQVAERPATQVATRPVTVRTTAPTLMASAGTALPVLVPPLSIPTTAPFMPATDAATPARNGSSVVRSLPRWAAALALLGCGVIHVPMDLGALREGGYADVVSPAIAVLCLVFGIWLAVQESVGTWAAAAATAIGVLAVYSTSGFGAVDVLGNTLGETFVWADVTAVSGVALAAVLATAALFRRQKAAGPAGDS